MDRLTPVLLVGGFAKGLAVFVLEEALNVYDKLTGRGEGYYERFLREHPDVVIHEVEQDTRDRNPYPFD